jgi:hypothetical protein
MADQEFNRRTRDLWQAKTSRKLADEDVREIAANVSGFFRLLAEWNQEVLRRQEQPPTDEQKTGA